MIFLLFLIFYFFVDYPVYLVDNLSNVTMKEISFSSGLLSVSNKRSEVTINTNFKKVLSVYVSRLLSSVEEGDAMTEYANIKTITGSNIIMEFEYVGSRGSVGIEGRLIVMGII